MKKRELNFTRKTLETDISLRLVLDGQGNSQVESGIGFLNHMLETLARHARFDLELKCSGDIRVDDHHTAEDVALALGEALEQLLGDRRGIARFGSAYAPLDEALARAVVDFSGRPFAVVNLGLKNERVGDLGSDNAAHVLQSLAIAARASFHVDVLRGENDHHKVEAAFKALALALKQAVACDGFSDVPSTKGML